MRRYLQLVPLLLLIICLLTNSSEAAMLCSSENFMIAINEGSGEYIIDSKNDIYPFEKTSKGTITVNIQKNASSSLLEIVLMDTSYSIVGTKSISGTGSRQFLQVATGSYYIFIRNDGAATVLEVNVYY